MGPAHLFPPKDKPKQPKKMGIGPISITLYIEDNNFPGTHFTRQLQTFETLNQKDTQSLALSHSSTTDTYSQRSQPPQTSSLNKCNSVFPKALHCLCCCPKLEHNKAGNVEESVAQSTWQKAHKRFREKKVVRLSQIFHFYVFLLHYHLFAFIHVQQLLVSSYSDIKQTQSFLHCWIDALCMILYFDDLEWWNWVYLN